MVLAAGAGQRFGGPKQLADLDGRPLLEHVLAAMAATPLGCVIAVLGARAAEIAAAVNPHGARVVVCPDWEQGQAASLRAGIAALGHVSAAVVVLGDQPRISPRAVERVLAGRSSPALAVRATYAGKPGHPVVLERALFDAIARLRGDEGARALLRRVAVRDVACDGLGRPDDVDTPEQLEVLRA